MSIDGKIPGANEEKGRTRLQGCLQQKKKKKSCEEVEVEVEDCGK